MEMADMEAPENKHFIECSCGSEVLMLQYDEEIDVWYICIFERIGARMTWWNRIRTIWHTLRYGTPYGDQIVLRKDEMEQLLNFVKQKGKE